MNNCNAVKRYLFLNKKMPQKGVKNPETGTELKSWYYNQTKAYAENRLEEERVKILIDAFGFNWNKGPSVDIGDFADFDFLVGLGLLKNPKYIDYCRKDGTIEVRFHFLNYGEEHRSLDLASELDGSTLSVF